MIYELKQEDMRKVVEIRTRYDAFCPACGIKINIATWVVEGELEESDRVMDCPACDKQIKVTSTEKQKIDLCDLCNKREKAYALWTF